MTLMIKSHYITISDLPFICVILARIDALQKQVEEQSMTMSMYSSMSTTTNMENSNIMLSSSYLSHIDDANNIG